MIIENFTQKWDRIKQGYVNFRKSNNTITSHRAFCMKNHLGKIASQITMAKIVYACAFFLYKWFPEYSDQIVYEDQEICLHVFISRYASQCYIIVCTIQLINILSSISELIDYMRRQQFSLDQLEKRSPICNN